MFFQGTTDYTHFNVKTKYFMENGFKTAHSNDHAFDYIVLLDIKHISFKVVFKRFYLSNRWSVDCIDNIIC